MAAGSGSASGHSARGSSAALEASLDRRLQGFSNTMESIQGLSTWCIENKKYNSLIVRYWMKWLKKSDTNHRLNLFYLANDVIQNCKRKNAIVFRSAFAEVLPGAAQLVKDGKVRKSVERIFTIWEERSVYPEELISQLKASLLRKDREREREKERQKEKEKEKEKERVVETPPQSAPVTPKAALKSKIVEEFTPLSLIEQLSSYKRAAEEEEFREKQLAALRVDVCSTEALKRLKDKAGGNKFATDLEDGSQKLQEFVAFLENELPTGPPLLETLGNADVFYEMQYKEVKIVANAYNTFANRVASLKRKLDALKSTLPGSEDSPIPSPSEDAPSPTGSDSPFMGLGEMGAGKVATLDPELDGSAMDDGELARDNRDPEDMELSDEDTTTTTTTAATSSSLSVEEKKDKMSSTVTRTTKVATLSKLTLPTTPIRSNKSSPAPANPGTPVPLAVGQSTPTTPLGVNLANVDLGKISSILSSITSAMNKTADSPSRPSPGTPNTPSGQSTSSKATPPSPALASILSRVDITPEGILNALSKTNTTGLSSLLHSVTSNSSSAATNRSSPESMSVKAPPTPTAPKIKPTPGNSLKRNTPFRMREWENNSSPPPPPPPAPPISLPSLESKINSFLQGNPGFSLSLGDGSPLLAGDGVDGTPVRDETGGTPTQDEIMDLPTGGHNLSPTAYRSDPWDAVITPSGSGSDRDFLSSSRSQSHTAGMKSGGKVKDEEALKMRKLSGSSSSPQMKSKRDAQSSQGKSYGSDRAAAAGERRASAGSRKASSGSEEGGFGGRRDEKGNPSLALDGEGQYHRIETLVSPCTEGAPIQALAYSNRPPAGERIQTVESIRVMRRGGGAGGRPGGGMWYEDGGFMEASPPSPHGAPPPPKASLGGSDEIAPPMPPPPPHLHHPHPHQLPPPPNPFQMPYHGDNMQTPPPSHLHQHPPPHSPFFNSPPPIPRPPPPPIPQNPPPPRHFPGPPSVVMVGGVMVPVDRPLPPLHLMRSEGGDRGGAGHGPRGVKSGPTPLMSSLLGEPPKLPRPGTVKEHFGSRHAPPLHRPGTPGAPPPLLGRVKEGLAATSSPSPTTLSPSTPTPPSPSGDPRPPALQIPPASPPAQPRQSLTTRRSSPPVSLLHLPNSSPRTPILSTPVAQRPLLRGPPPHLNREPHMGGFRGGKRPGPPYSGGPFLPPKRSFPPPRY